MSFRSNSLFNVNLYNITFSCYERTPETYGVGMYLCTQNLPIYDIDSTKERTKDDILASLLLFEKKNNSVFYIFETFKGLRVFDLSWGLIGWNETTIREVKNRMELLGVDSRYKRHVFENNYFSARLTPKTFRKEKTVCTLLYSPQFSLKSPLLVSLIDKHNSFCLSEEYCSLWYRAEPLLLLELNNIKNSTDNFDEF